MVKIIRKELYNVFLRKQQSRKNFKIKINFTQKW